MVHIQVDKGLTIPLSGNPSGSALLPLPAQLEELSLNLRAFPDLKGRLLVKVGDIVQKGQPLVEDKSCPGKMFVSPAAGTVKEIRRGLKRVLLDIVIQVAKQETEYPICTQGDLLECFKLSGLFSFIRKRPFNHLADPKKKPKALFINAVETAPFTPPIELHLKGHEQAFQAGILALKELTAAPLHLVIPAKTQAKALLNASAVNIHTIQGPHPAGNVSLHIQSISPIHSQDDCIWTIHAKDVIKIGYLLTKKTFFTDEVIGIGGPGILPDQVGFFKIRQGFPINLLMLKRVKDQKVRLISGDPLMGDWVTSSDFLGFYDRVFCAIPDPLEREFLHFFRLGLNKYSFSRAYLSGHLDHRNKDYFFTTSQHGEERAFIDGSLYDQVMPLHIPTMPLIKAVLAEDFELAELLGLLQVDPEDFALPAFVCPSKIEMPEIIREGLKKYALGL